MSGTFNTDDDESEVIRHLHIPSPSSAVEYSITFFLLSTMYLVLYSLTASRFMVSVLIPPQPPSCCLSPDSFDHWCLFLPIQHAREQSRPIWLQAAESAYRFTLGSIAGGE